MNPQENQVRILRLHIKELEKEVETYRYAAKAADLNSRLLRKECLSEAERADRFFAAKQVTAESYSTERTRRQRLEESMRYIAGISGGTTTSTSDAADYENAMDAIYQQCLADGFGDQ